MIHGPAGEDSRYDRVVYSSEENSSRRSDRRPADWPERRRHKLVGSPRSPVIWLCAGRLFYCLTAPDEGSSRNCIDLATGFPSLIS